LLKLAKEYATSYYIRSVIERLIKEYELYGDNNSQGFVITIPDELLERVDGKNDE
jgi:predicted DNA-binding protein